MVLVVVAVEVPVSRPAVRVPGTATACTGNSEVVEQSTLGHREEPDLAHRGWVCLGPEEKLVVVVVPILVSSLGDLGIEQATGLRPPQWRLGAGCHSPGLSRRHPAHLRPSHRAVARAAALFLVIAGSGAEASSCESRPRRFCQVGIKSLHELALQR